MKKIINILILFKINFTSAQQVLPIIYSPKIIIQQEKLWSYDYENPNIANIQFIRFGKQDTFLQQYDGLLFDNNNPVFTNSTISWDVDTNGIYGLCNLNLHFDAAFCHGASGMLMKIASRELSTWKKNVTRPKEFDYWKSDREAFMAHLPLVTWFKKNYDEKGWENWRNKIYQPPFKDIADSVIRNTYFDFFKLKSNDSTSFFALCEGNVLSAWHFDRSKQQKLREYPFKPTGYFHVLEHQNKPYLISAEGTVFKIGRRLKKVQQLPRPLKDGWLIVDKDHDKIYFLEQQYFSFADKPRAIREILKNAFVIF